ncbi:hypothetical protein CROQUDRAFT_50132 [Cronartium quercuum f. sp. fusiforme G11]|uniref:Uncharacterized protein n=1 Tax=Cronartium quercuum f. sp. fusiforme G11 TaxID=708437 RepID=A0A9P6N9Q1_9BASI|nr:hypothetical protein CROQUDRAFT_50132 [Cronartium quercuum f. sp. fusiforme G11]
MFRAGAKSEGLPTFTPSPSSKRLLTSKGPRRKRSRSHSRLHPALYDILYTYPASFRTLILLLLLGGLLFWISTNLLVLFRFLFIDTLFSAGLLGKTHLALRKQPLIFIHSPWSAAVVWETNQNRTEDGRHQKGVGLRYWKSSPVNQNGLKTILMGDVDKAPEVMVPVVDVKRPTGRGDQNRWVHSVILDNLEPGSSYNYELVLESSEPCPTDPRHSAVLKSYGAYEFTWLGINPPDPAHIDHISDTSPTANRTVTPFHISIIGDTYKNPRQLHSLTKKYLDLQSYMPSPTSSFRPRKITKSTGSLPTKPHTLIHLGNAVSDPEDHREWQTSFWDPLTFQQKASSEVPILYARGPRDFDLNGTSIYTGGLPAVQLGELNRTRVALLKHQENRIILPGFTVAERQYTAIKSIKRDRRTRASFVGYSPHPRVRILVLDPNLVPERQAFIGSRSSLTELGDHEHWLLWEMARPEWKEASIRMIVVNVAPFPEYVDPQSWAENSQNNWETYVRTVFAPHFHAISPISIQFDIPPATIVISSQPAAYYRGLLQNHFARHYVNAVTPDKISANIKKGSNVEHDSTSDPHAPEIERGVIYVTIPGQGSGIKHTHPEGWGFYEIASDFSHRKNPTSFFSDLRFDLATTSFDSHEDQTMDWDENTVRRIEWEKEGIRFYHMLGSQSVCEPVHKVDVGHEDESYQKKNEKKFYGIGYDRLYFRVMTTKGQVIDKFVIEAAACRST